MDICREGVEFSIHSKIGIISVTFLSWPACSFSSQGRSWCAAPKCFSNLFRNKVVDVPRSESLSIIKYSFKRVKVFIPSMGMFYFLCVWGEKHSFCSDVARPVLKFPIFLLLFSPSYRFFIVLALLPCILSSDWAVPKPQFFFLVPFSFALSKSDKNIVVFVRFMERECVKEFRALREDFQPCSLYLVIVDSYWWFLPGTQVSSTFLVR